MQNIFGITIGLVSLAFKNVYQFICAEQEGPNNGEVHRSVGNCRLSVWTMFTVIFLMPFFLISILMKVAYRDHILIFEVMVECQSNI